MVFAYLKKIQSLDFFHRLPTTNWQWIPFVNTILIKFWHRRFRLKSFFVLLKIPYVKIQIFRDRSFKWDLNYYFAKF